jgi:hypothetical protein
VLPVSVSPKAERAQKVVAVYRAATRVHVHVFEVLGGGEVGKEEGEEKEERR